MKKENYSPQETLGWTLEITIKSNKEKEKKKNGIKETYPMKIIFVPEPLEVTQEKKQKLTNGKI